MKDNRLTIEILEDGTIKTTSDEVSTPTTTVRGRSAVQLEAQQFLEVAKALRPDPNPFSSLHDVLGSGKSEHREHS